MSDNIDNRLEEKRSILNKSTVGQRGSSNRTVTMKEHNYYVSVLCILFGMGAWILINSVFTQMPILVENAPEKWSLPSYFSLLIQLANIGPLLYILLKNKTYFFKDSILISFLLILGTSSIIALAFTYDKTDIIFGQLHSVYLFVFSFLMSLVGCVSSVLFIPFMNTLPEVYLVPYFIGEGLSGFMPSLISLVQGVQKNPTCVNITSNSGNVTTIKTYDPPVFSPKIFFFIIASLMALSTLSFIYLHFSSHFKHIKLRGKKVENQERIKNYSEIETIAMTSETEITKSVYVILLIVQTILNSFSNGILPSIESYSCLPYGNSAYHLAVTLGQMANPVTSYISFFIPLTSLRLLMASCCTFILCLIYELITAFLSPSPPLNDSTFGIAIVVAVWILGSASISFSKLSIAAIFRRKDTQSLFHYGVVTQIGSAVGSILSFYMVNYSNLLHSVPSTDIC